MGNILTHNIDTWCWSVATCKRRKERLMIIAFKKMFESYPKYLVKRARSALDSTLFCQRVFLIEYCTIFSTKNAWVLCKNSFLLGEKNMETNSPFHGLLCSFALHWNLACMSGNFWLFCSLSPRLPCIHVGLRCNAYEKS